MSIERVIEDLSRVPAERQCGRSNLFIRAVLPLILFFLISCEVDSREIEGVERELADVEFVTRMIRAEEAAVAAGDLDGDGHDDLVVAGMPELSIFRGDGEGNLVLYGRVEGGENPVDFVIEDVTEDGQVDIVVANHDTGYLTILRGSGNGRFEPASNSPLSIDVSPHPHAVRAADLDTDGHFELIVDHRDGNGILVIRGLGGGRFESSGVLFECGGDPYRGMAVGDLDGDGDPDLVTPNPREVGVLINTSEKTLELTPAAPVPATAPFAVALADLDDDGALDLVVASGESSSVVEIFLGDGRGGFEEDEESPFRLAPGGKNIAVGDFDGDGVQDVAVSSWGSSEVLLLFGGAVSFRTTRIEGGQAPWGLAVADFNEDGKDDLVIGDGKAPRAIVHLSQSE